MASSSTPPPFVPTLTEVVRLPERKELEAVNHQRLVEQVVQRMTPHLEALVRQTVADALAELHDAPPQHKRLQD